MTSSQAQDRPRAVRPAPVVDQFGVVVAIAVTALWAICGLPALGGAPASADIALTVGVTVVAVLAAVQWLALLRRFEATPPLPAAIVGIVAILVAAAFAGQLGALLGLVGGMILAYCWRIAQVSESRLADVAYVVAALVVFGFFPAQVLLLARLGSGPAGLYIYLVTVLVFEVVQAVLSRPARDGTRSADMSTLAAAVGATVTGVVAGVVAGDPIGATGGLVIGVAIGGAGAAGRACIPLLAPAPEVEGRRVRRRPLLLDALAPHLFAAPAAFLAVRMVAAA